MGEETASRACPAHVGHDRIAWMTFPRAFNGVICVKHEQLIPRGSGAIILRDIGEHPPPIVVCENRGIHRLHAFDEDTPQLPLLRKRDTLVEFHSAVPFCLWDHVPNTLI